VGGGAAVAELALADGLGAPTVPGGPGLERRRIAGAFRSGAFTGVRGTGVEGRSFPPGRWGYPCPPGRWGYPREDLGDQFPQPRGRLAGGLQRVADAAGAVAGEEGLLGGGDELDVVAPGFAGGAGGAAEDAGGADAGVEE